VQADPFTSAWFLLGWRPAHRGGMPAAASRRQAAGVEPHVHDLHATILHLLGLDHERLTYRSGGRDYRLTDVHGNVVTALIA